MRNSKLFIGLVSLTIILLGSSLFAQPMHNEGNFPHKDRAQMGQPPMDMQGQPPMGAQGPRGQRNMRRPRQMTPEMIKMREKQQAIMTIAEAHKELAQVYIHSNKIDAAAAEYKKIIKLAEDSSLDELKKDDKRGKKFLKKMMPIYIEIAKLYNKNNRLDDAEKILNEGVAKFEKDDPSTASKLLLFLGKTLTNAEKPDKAEAVFKRVIQLNQKSLK